MIHLLADDIFEMHSLFPAKTQEIYNVSQNVPFAAVITGLPWSGKKFWKMKNFPGQGKVRELHFHREI